jgi:hypothetical protein
MRPNTLTWTEYLALEITYSSFRFPKNIYDSNLLAMNNENYDEEA